MVKEKNNILKDVLKMHITLLKLYSLCLIEVGLMIKVVLQKMKALKETEDVLKEVKEELKILKEENKKIKKKLSKLKKKSKEQDALIDCLASTSISTHGLQQQTVLLRDIALHVPNSHHVSTQVCLILFTACKVYI